MYNILDDIASLIDMMEQGVLPDLQGNPVKVTQEQIAQMKRALHKDMWKGKVPVHPIPGISAPPTRQAGLAAAPVDMGQKHGSEDGRRGTHQWYSERLTCRGICGREQGRNSTQEDTNGEERGGL